MRAFGGYQAPPGSARVSAFSSRPYAHSRPIHARATPGGVGSGTVDFDSSNALCATALDLFLHLEKHSDRSESRAVKYEASHGSHWL
jgi:hypothetical protein